MGIFKPQQVTLRAECVNMCKAPVIPPDSKPFLSPPSNSTFYKQRVAFLVQR